MDIEINSKSITKITIQLFSEVATQSLGLHQIAQRIEDRYGQVTRKLLQYRVTGLREQETETPFLVFTIYLYLSQLDD